MTAELQSARKAYITVEPETDGKLDREATLHRRRKLAMISLLSEFERELQPYVQGHDKQIDDFKRSCREKLNGLTFLAIELMRDDGEINEVAVDLAGKLAFGDNGGPG